MSWNKEYPLAVYYPRTAAWYEGEWADISSWCNKMFGAGEWEYFNSEFRFKNQQQVNWFNMRWGA